MSIEALSNSNNSGRDTRSVVLDPPGGMLPYHPWARARRDEVLAAHLHPNHAQVDTRTRAWPDGVPRINYYGVNPFQILQSAGQVVIYYEAMHEFRIIPLGDRPPLGADIELWMGSSRGRWEGNTLVVEVTNHNDRTRFSVVGDFHSDKMKVTERWTFVDADTIQHRATIEDPVVYTRPWTIGSTIRRVKDKGFEIMEYAGVEGEKDVDLMVGIPATVKKRGTN